MSSPLVEAHLMKALLSAFPSVHGFSWASIPVPKFPLMPFVLVLAVTFAIAALTSLIKSRRAYLAASDLALSGAATQRQASAAVVAQRAAHGREALATYDAVADHRHAIAKKTTELRHCRSTYTDLNANTKEFATNMLRVVNNARVEAEDTILRLAADNEILMEEVEALCVEVAEVNESAEGVRRLAAAVAPIVTKRGPLGERRVNAMPTAVPAKTAVPAVPVENVQPAEVVETN